MGYIAFSLRFYHQWYYFGKVIPLLLESDYWPPSIPLLPHHSAV